MQLDLGLHAALTSADFHMQEHEAALRYFQRATQLDPGFAYAYTLSGHEYFACEDFEQARKLYETALSVDRRHYNAWCALPFFWGLHVLYTNSCRPGCQHRKEGC